MLSCVANRWEIKENYYWLITKGINNQNKSYKPYAIYYYYYIQ